MSTDRKRLTSAIQRIAREDPEIRKLLKDFRNSGGKPSESATSGSGAENRQICCDGSTGGGGTNPGSGTKDPNESPQDGIDPDDPAKISDNLAGVTDCATGQPICFEGSDWIPPYGWDSPTEPPEITDWEQGYYYTACSGSWPLGEDSSVSCTNVASFSLAIMNLAGSPNSPDESSRKDVYTQQNLYGETWRHRSYKRYDCSDSYAPGVCDLTEAPTVEFWPEDGCVNLAIKGGKLVASKYDPENDGSWSAPRDEVELCDEFGNKFKLSGSASGGWKTINPLNPDDGYLYDSSGNQIARISGSEYSDPSV